MDHPRQQLPLRRRTLLGGAVALLAGLTACAKPVATNVDVPATVSRLVTERPFFIAHRGGGGNWPEMTAYAYQQAAALPGLQAMEVSVCLTRDRVLVCSHDPTTTRVTGRPYVIAEQDWTTLASLAVSAAGTSDPTQPPRPFSRFDGVVPALIDRFVVFVEPKVSAAVDPLLRAVAAFGQPERVVWKQPINSPHFAKAKRLGFSTWGYLLDEPAHRGQNLTRLAARAEVDMLGAPLSAPDALCRQVVEAARRNAKPVIAQTVSTAQARDRALALGASGLMVSRIADLLPKRA